MSEAVRRVLADSTEPAPAATPGAWAAGLRERTAGLALPIDRAIVGGFGADRVAFAFAAGYRAALSALVGELPGAGDGPVALCITEAKGAHPRAIETTLTADGEGYRVTGSKRWTTLGPDGAGVLLVAASTGLDAEGKNRLALVRIDAAAPGVTLTAMAETPFVPEIPHAEVRFDGVRVGAGARLPGDGYLRYVKPFRTVEDLHVHAAVVAYVLRVARLHGAPALVAGLAAVLAAARALALEDPLAPETHVALAGTIDLARRLLADTGPLWAAEGAETRARWERDQPLLEVAGAARAKRTESAFRALAARSTT